MKKILFFAFLILSLGHIAANNHNGNRYRNERNVGDENNISPDSLPKSITSYLGKNYLNYAILISKVREDGYYFVKIRYNNPQRPYYRSLVFDNNGNVVKG